MTVSILVQAMLDDTQLQAKEKDWHGRISRLNQDLSDTEYHILMVTRRAFRAIDATINAITGVIKAFGIALPASVAAMISACQGVFASLMAMVTAYLAGGVTAPYAMALEAVAVGFAIGTLAITMATGSQVNARVTDAENAVRDLGWAATAWTRFLSGAEGY
jgi:hypothetical protein